MQLCKIRWKRWDKCRSIVANGILQKTYPAGRSWKKSPTLAGLTPYGVLYRQCAETVSRGSVLFDERWRDHRPLETLEVSFCNVAICMFGFYWRMVLWWSYGSNMIWFLDVESRPSTSARWQVLAGQFWRPKTLWLVWCWRAQGMDFVTQVWRSGYEVECLGLSCGAERCWTGLELQWGVVRHRKRI